MPKPPISVHENEVLQKYYLSDEDYFDELKKKDFSSWFPKYYVKLKPVNDGPILDVGCGAGQVINRFSEKGFYAVGVDVSLIGIRIAGENGKGIFIVASAHMLPFKDDSFESVGSYDFLEHTYYPKACLNEVVRVLKPQGRIVITSPNFLKVMGLRSDYHWHMRGFKQKALNFYNLLRKMIYLVVHPWKMAFDFMQPKLSQKSGDEDAVCVTNPLDVRYHLERLGVKIIYQSALSTFHSSRIIEKLSELPIIKAIAGGFFIMGVKLDDDSVKDSKFSQRLPLK